MTLRHATKTDAPTLQSLINNVFDRKTAGIINDSYFEDPSIITLVLENKETIMATASLHLLVKVDRRVGLIEDVVVHPDAQGQGLGKLVVAELLKIAETKDCYKVILNTAKKTAPFYEKLGFRTKEIQMEKRT